MENVQRKSFLVILTALGKGNHKKKNMFCQLDRNLTANNGVTIISMLKLNIVCVAGVVTFPYRIAAYAGMQYMLISYCIHTVFILLICPISAAQLQYIY